MGPTTRLFHLALSIYMTTLRCCLVFVLAAACFAEALPSANTCAGGACADSYDNKYVSNELDHMTAAGASVQLLQRRASEDITADDVDQADDAENDDENDETDEIDEASADDVDQADDAENDDENDETDEIDGSDGTTCKKKCSKKLDKWIKKGKEEKGLKKTCAKKFCKECDFCQTECNKKCSKKYDKFVKKGKRA